MSVVTLQINATPTPSHNHLTPTLIDAPIDTFLGGIDTTSHDWDRYTSPSQQYHHMLYQPFASHDRYGDHQYHPFLDYC